MPRAASHLVSDRRGVFRLSIPVPERVHNHIRVSSSRSRGSRGFRLNRRALGGIAPGLAPFMTRRHL